MNQKAQIGVKRTDLFFRETFGWIFRQQHEDDWGIDGHVEICDEVAPKNLLLGVQVKTGPSFFEHPKSDGSGWTVYLTNRHLDYWLYGSLPVILVVHDYDAKVGYWQIVNDQTAERTEKGWKIFVPRFQVLDEGVRERFEKLARGPTWAQRFRQLLLARKWMKYLAGGDVLIAQFDERIDTTVPRGSMKIIHRRYRADDDNDSNVVTEWPYYVRGNSTHESILAEMFDWADAFEDEDYYQDDLEDYNDNETGIYEDGEFVLNPFSVSDLRSRHPGAHAADILYDGEREGVYRYILKLNAVGKAFLVANEYLHDPDEMEELGMGLSDDEDDEYDEILDNNLTRARTIIRAWRFGWDLVDKPTKCTVHNSIDDPEKECGRAIKAGDGFRRWEPDERRVVDWCWTCLPDLWAR